MKKRGKFRAIRNLASGWVTHANHGRDFTERIYHHGFEAVLLLFVIVPIWVAGFPDWAYAVMFVAIHTAWWVINGNFHVYMLDSFRFVRNAGINAELKYILWVGKKFKRLDVLAILVYGSFCRREFHGRSDLDLRIIHRPGEFGVGLFLLSVWARIVSMMRGCPTDLQVVDSEDFLLRQMDAREIPINVWGGERLEKIRTSISISEVCARPEIVMKPEREFEGW